MNQIILKTALLCLWYQETLLKESISFSVSLSQSFDFVCVPYLPACLSVWHIYAQFFIWVFIFTSVHEWKDWRSQGYRVGRWICGNGKGISTLHLRLCLSFCVYIPVTYSSCCQPLSLSVSLPSSTPLSPPSPSTTPSSSTPCHVSFSLFCLHHHTILYLLFRYCLSHIFFFV